MSTYKLEVCVVEQASGMRTAHKIIPLKDKDECVMYNRADSKLRNELFRELGKEANMHDWVSGVMVTFEDDKRWCTFGDAVYISDESVA